MVAVISDLYCPLLSLLFSICEQWCPENVSPEVVPASLKKSEITQKEMQTLKENCSPVSMSLSADRMTLCWHMQADSPHCHVEF